MQDKWINGTYGKGYFNWDYGEWLTLLKVRNNKIIIVDQCERCFKEVTEEIFNHIKFEMIDEEQYDNLLEQYFINK